MNNFQITLYLREIQWKLTYFLFSYLSCLFVCYNYSNHFLFITTYPLISLRGLVSRDFIFTEMSEAFTISIWTSFYFSFLFCLPILVYYFYVFIRPSLYNKESQTVLCSLSLFLFFFYTSHYFAYSYLLPILFSFFLYFDGSTNMSSTVVYSSITSICLEPRIYPFIILTFQIFSIFSLCFQIPLIFFYLLFFGFLSLSQIVRFRKYVYFAFVLFGAFVSPPDFSSQLVIILLLLITFELFLIASFLLSKYTRNIKI